MKKTFKVTWDDPAQYGYPWMWNGCQFCVVNEEAAHYGKTIEDAIQSFCLPEAIKDLKQSLSSKRILFEDSVVIEPHVTLVAATKEKYHEYPYSWETPSCSGYWDTISVEISSIEEVAKHLGEKDSLSVEAELTWKVLSYETPRTKKDLKKATKK